MKKKITYFKITGMTCAQCEKAVERQVIKHPEVEFCRADYVKGLLRVELKDDETGPELITDLISRAGYTGEKISRSKKNIREAVFLGTAAAIIVLLYFSAEKTGILNRIPVISAEMGYPLLFVIGILTSFHCIGMCGGINLSQTGCASGVISKTSTLKKNLSYNAGRTLSYTLLGALVGGAGSVLTLSLTLQGIIVIIAGAIMIIMGLNMTGLFSFLKYLVPVFPESFSLKIKSLPEKQSPFVVGLLNGFMPCGPLQSMQLYALSTGSAVKGAISMLLFSTGTVPMMFIFGSLSILFPKRMQKNVMKISALLILVLGWGMISRGLSINGFSLNTQSSEEIAVNAAVAVIDGEYQYVRSDVRSYSYEPIVVQAGVPVKWTLYAPPGSINGCNNAVISNKFGIKQGLKEGETVIEFIPDIAGNFPFSCWMGMISSNILVVDDLASFDPELLNSKVTSEYEPIEVQIPEIDTDDFAFSKNTEGQLIAELEVDINGFGNSVLVMEKDKETIWDIKTGTIDENTNQIVFPFFRAQVDLQEHYTHRIKIVPTEDFYFYTWNGDYLGFVLVVESLEEINLDELMERIRLYTGR